MRQRFLWMGTLSKQRMSQTAISFKRLCYEKESHTSGKNTELDTPDQRAKSNA